MRRYINSNIWVENDTVYNRGLGGEILSASRALATAPQRLGTAEYGFGNEFKGKALDNENGESYFAYNGHGDTTNLTKQSSGTALAITATYDYDAFGNCTATGGEADANPFRYNGQYTDSETGLIYLRNRYYDPTIGRFTQEDPAKDGLNWYVYCNNDPVNMVDPLGLAGKNSNKVYEIGNGIEVSLAGKGYYDYLVSKLDTVTIDGRALTEDEKTLYKTGYAYKAQYMEENGLLKGANYNNDVKHFEQREAQLCWAYTFAMMASATDTSLDSQKAADEYVKGLVNSGNYSVTNDGTLNYTKVSENSIGSSQQVQNLFLSKIENGPFAIRYADGQNGHIVAVTAVMKIDGIIYIMARDSNNIICENEWITFDDFMSYNINYIDGNGKQVNMRMNYAGICL